MYAATPARRARQIVGDIATLVAVVFAVVVGRAVHDAIAHLATIGATVQRDGAAFQQRLSDTARALRGLPFGGGTIAAPLQQASRSAAHITQAGAEQRANTLHLATIIGVLVAAAIALAVIAIWVRTRGRDLRAASAAATLSTTPGGVEILAARALHRDAVLELGADIAARWRHGDPDAITALAHFELDRLGVRQSMPRT